MNLGLQRPLQLITVTKGSSLSQNRRHITRPLPRTETPWTRSQELYKEYNLRLKEIILLLENYNNWIKDVIRLVEDKSLSST